MLANRSPTQELAGSTIRSHGSSGASTYNSMEADYQFNADSSDKTAMSMNSPSVIHIIPRVNLLQQQGANNKVIRTRWSRSHPSTELRLSRDPVHNGAIVRSVQYLYAILAVQQRMAMITRRPQDKYAAKQSDELRAIHVKPHQI